jgi:hypothetical protein
MIHLLDIVFSYGDNINPEKSWIADYLIPIGTSLIVAGAAIFAVKKTFNEQRKKDKEEIKRRDIERIKYLQVLIRNIIERIEKQIKGLTDHALAVEQRPLETQRLTIFQFTDIKQIVYRINQEEYYQSYTAIFSNSPESINEITTIFSILASFDLSFESMIDNVGKATLMDNENKLNFLKSLKDIIHTLSKIRDVLPSPGGDILGPQIDNIMKNYIENKKKELQYEYENLIMPLFTELPKFRNLATELHEVLVQIDDSRISYLQIKLNRSSEVDEYRNLETSFKTSLTKLQANCEKLLNYN